MSEVYQQCNKRLGPVSHNEISSEMARFNEGLRQALSVSKEDLRRLLADEKAANADKPKRGPKPFHPVSGASR